MAVIERFLPKQLSEDETRAAIEAIKAELGAVGMKDMGRVMASSRRATRPRWTWPGRALR